MPRINPLTADQLAAATLHMVGNYEITRIPRSELLQMFASFLAPLTHEGVSMKCVYKLFEAANDYYDAWETANNPMDDDRPGWLRKAEKDRRRVEVIAASIVDGGSPE